MVNLFKKSLFSLFLLLILIGSAQAVNFGPKDIGAARITVIQNWTINFSNNIPSFFDLKVFGFKNTYFQNASIDAVASLPYTQGTDSLGNTVLTFHLTPTSSVETVELESIVDLNYYNSPTYSNTPNITYLDPTSITGYDPQMLDQAQLLVQGSNSNLEKLTSITNFVHNWITYAGFGYGPSINNATYIYYARHGFCGDYAHLEIALLKAVGIPARFVAGLVCSDNCTDFANSQTNWGSHGWIEAYIGGQWIPADPTFNEVGVLDATHAKFYQGPDQLSFQEQYSSPYNYPLQQVISTIVRNTSVQVNYFTPATPQAQLSIYIPENTVGPNSIVNITANLNNPTGFETSVPLSILVPSELKISENSDTIVYLPPYSNSSYTWTAITPDNLTNGYDYIFPIGIQTLGQTIWTNITANSDFKSTNGSSVGLQGFTFTSYIQNSSETLDFKIQNFGNQPDNINATLNFNGITLNKQIVVSGQSTTDLNFILPYQIANNATEGTLKLESTGSYIVQPFKVYYQSPAPLVQINPVSTVDLGSSNWQNSLIATLSATIIILVLILVVLKRN